MGKGIFLRIIVESTKGDKKSMDKIFLDVLKNKPDTLRIACGGAGQLLVDKRNQFAGNDKEFFEWFDKDFMTLLTKTD